MSTATFPVVRYGSDERVYELVGDGPGYVLVGRDSGLEDDGPTCSICDGLGHGYVGGPPCPLEDNAWDDGFDEWEAARGVR